MPKTTCYSTINELKELMSAIVHGKSELRLGYKSREILGKLLDVPEQVAVSSISELAEQFGVSPSTFTRLAKKLGYLGFNEFQDVFRKDLTGGSHYFYSQQASSLNQAVCTDQHLLNTITQQTVQNLQLMLRQIDSCELQQAAQKLAHAPRVRLYAERQFYALASFISYGLSLIRKDVSLLEAQRMGLASALSELDGDDVLLVVSCEPYTRNVVHVTKAAYQCDVHIIAVTDYRSSPLIGFAQQHFFVPHQSSFISNSMGAYIVFAEGLVNAVATELGEDAMQALRDYESLIGELNVSL